MTPTDSPLRSASRRVAAFLVIAVVVGACGKAPAPTPGPPTETPTPPPCPVAPRNPTAVIDNYLTSAEKNGIFSGAVLIACQGQIVLSKGYGMSDRVQAVPNTAQTKYRLGGLTSPFTATAVVIMDQLGMLDVKDPVCKYITDCPAAWKDITLHHLLSHSSGIPDYLAETSLSQASTRDGLIGLFINKPLDFQPGTQYAWSNSDYVLLGQVIEKANSEGWDYETFLQQAIFGSLKMANTGYDRGRTDLAVGYDSGSLTTPAPALDASNLDAAGALYSTVEDLFRFDQALYTAGWDLAGRGQNMSKDSIAMMFKPRAIVPYTRPINFGYGWFLEERGGHQAQTSYEISLPSVSGWITRYPNDQVTFILLGNQGGQALPEIVSTLHSLVFGEPCNCP